MVCTYSSKLAGVGTVVETDYSFRSSKMEIRTRNGSVVISETAISRSTLLSELSKESNQHVSIFEFPDILDDDADTRETMRVAGDCLHYNKPTDVPRNILEWARVMKVLNYLSSSDDLLKVRVLNVLNSSQKA